MRHLWVLLLVFAVAVAGSGCRDDTTSDSDKQMAEQTERTMQEAHRQAGMPAIRNFQERKLAKMIFELRDQEDLICYAYIVNKMQGKLVFIGKCIGFGLPYSVQYTNPERLVKGGNSQGRWGTTIPQADPSGLFMPTGLSATWLMMVEPKTGKARPVYIEPEIVVSPFPLHR